MVVDCLQPGLKVIHPPAQLGILFIRRLSVPQLYGKLGHGHRLRGYIRIPLHAVRVVACLVAVTSGLCAGVVQAALLPLQGVQLILDPQDTQEDVRPLLIGCVEELRQIQRQGLDKLIQQLLAAALARFIHDSQGALRSLSDHSQAVGKLHPKLRIKDAALPLRRVRPEALAAQCPGNAVQHAGLALAVLAADHRKSGRRRLQGHSLDPLHVGQLQGGDADVLHLVHLRGIILIVQATISPFVGPSCCRRAASLFTASP